MTKVNEKPKQTGPKPRISAFDNEGFNTAIEHLEEEVRELYCVDDSPWIIGYSGGKDSTAILQLIWNAISKLPSHALTKTIHVISTDTLVENPIVAAWVAQSLKTMGVAAEQQGLPIQPHRLTPKIADSFWVNLIGRGYPAPRNKFRWCTDRLKIQPSTNFIKGVLSASGEALLVLGTRKAESTARAANMSKHEKGRVKARISPNAQLPGSWVYTPVEDWSNDDVWFFLMQVKNPWGYNNRDLLGMYAGASADGECPLVVDDTTPSCGSSRFGCWVCTLVEEDKSMTAMIQNDEEKEWMMPLLELRNELDFRKGGATEEDPDGTDRHLRDFRRMKGSVQIMSNGRYIPGPYTQDSRRNWLAKLLSAQCYIRDFGPAEMKDLELINIEELREIRRIWVVDKHELEDTLPTIYKETTGMEYPGGPLDDNAVLGSDDMEVLAEICGEDRFHYELTRDLLSLTLQQRNSARRAGLFKQLESTFRRHFYDDEVDALDRASRLAEERGGIGHSPAQLDLVSQTAEVTLGAGE